MNVLVTGGFGFVGGRVAKALHCSGKKVVLGSRLKRSRPKWLSNSETRLIDWESLASLREACHSIDAVVHASGMNAASCTANPSLALQVNGVQTAMLLEASIMEGVDKFFYFSTAHVYASPLQGDINEKTCPRNMHPYASSHLAGEHALLHALEQGMISGSSLRLANSFGAPICESTDCWNLLVNDLCRQAVTTKKLVLQSSGRQLRNFVPLSVVGACLVKLLDQPVQKLPQILNIGSGSSDSVLQLAKLIQERCLALLDYMPELVLGEREEVALPLKYESLHADFVEIESNNTVCEIDELLVYCKERFAAI